MSRVFGHVSDVGPRGFGFLRPEVADPGQKDIHFHAAFSKEGVFDQLKVNDRVSFEIATTSEGKPHAVKVKLAPRQVGLTLFGITYAGGGSAVKVLSVPSFVSALKTVKEDSAKK